MEFLETAVALFLSIGWFLVGYYLGAGTQPPPAVNPSTTAWSTSPFRGGKKGSAKPPLQGEVPRNEAERFEKENQLKAASNETADAINCLVNYSSEIAYGN